MFKLRQTSKKSDPAAASKRTGKPSAKKSAPARPSRDAAKKSASARPAREGAEKKRGASKAKGAAGAPLRKGKPLPKPLLDKAPKRGSATTQRRDMVLRKRTPGPALDLGVGAHTVEPAAGTPPTSGLKAAQAAIEKKATDIVLLDVREVSGLCDEMLIATTRSVPHMQSVAEAVEEAMRKAGERVVHRDGLAGAEPDWVLLDYGDLMVHIFRAAAREQYALEAYYGQARLVARWKNEEK